MSSTSFSRRRLLAAMAAAGGASRLAPFIPAAVHAAGAPRRILSVFSPMGYLDSSFWPTGSGADFTLGETQTALTPWKSKLIYLDGLALYGPIWFFKNDDNEHGAGGAMVFTGSKKAGGATGPSVEQAVADFQYAQVKTPFRALALGVNSGNGGGHTAVFYKGAQTPVVGQTKPQTTFDMLFAGFTGPTASPAGVTSPAPSPAGPSPADTARRQRQSVLDAVKADIARIRGLAGRDDQAKLDAHLDGVSSLENRLKLMGGNAAPANAPTASTPPVPAGSVTNGCARPTLSATGVQQSVHAQMDLIVAAFACDMTRHATLQLGICDGGLDVITGVNQHNTTHAVGDTKGDPVHIDNHKKYDRWFADRWAYLLGKLDSIKEGNGTMLDNTLIVFGSDTTTLTSTAYGFGAHCHVRFPLWLAGGGNFAFKTGQAIKLPMPAKGPGSPTQTAQWVVHQRLLTSICQAFGMNVDSFGTYDPGTGPLAQLTRV